MTTPEAHPVALDHAGAVPGLAAQEVGRPHDPRLGVQVGVDLPAVVGVVAEGDRVDASREQLVGDLGGDPQPPGDVLAVDHHELGRVALAQERKAVEQRAPADAPDEVADEQDAQLGPGARPAVRPPPGAQPYFANGGRQVRGVSESTPARRRPTRSAPPGARADSARRAC